MKVELLVSDWCQSCHLAERVWREVAEERDIEFAVVDMGQLEGRSLASRLHLKSIPSTVIDGELKAVGVQTKEQALALIAGAPRKAASSTQHIGLSMERTSRIAILSSMLYLFAAGSSLVMRGGSGGLFAVGAARVAPLHLYTLGFLVFLIYGLGEHLLPRFTGNPIRLGAPAWTQLGCAHLGALGFALGLWLGTHLLALLGALFAWSGLLLFTVRIWSVLWPRGTHSSSPPDRAPSQVGEVQ